MFILGFVMFYTQKFGLRDCPRFLQIKLHISVKDSLSKVDSSDNLHHKEREANLSTIMQSVSGSKQFCFLNEAT